MILATHEGNYQPPAMNEDVLNVAVSKNNIKKKKNIHLFFINKFYPKSAFCHKTKQFLLWQVCGLLTLDKQECRGLSIIKGAPLFAYVCLRDNISI